MHTTQLQQVAYMMYKFCIICIETYYTCTLKVHVQESCQVTDCAWEKIAQLYHLDGPSIKRSPGRWRMIMTALIIPFQAKRVTVHQSNETLDHEMGQYLASHVKPSQARPGQAPNSHNGHSPHYRGVHAYMCCRLCT